MTALTDIMYKILVLLMSLYTATGGSIAEPAQDDLISSVDPANVQVTAAFWGDTQVSDYLLSRQLYTKNSCIDVSNATENIDALIHVGDIAENGKGAEYKLLTDDFSVIDNVDNFLFASGNHDIRMRIYPITVKTFTSFVNGIDKNHTIDKLWYSRDINGYKFIVLGATKTMFEESYLSDEELNWLDGELADGTKDGNPVFVICHQPIQYTHGLPETWGSPLPRAGSVGAQSAQLTAIMAKYKNVFYLTGHLHTGFGEYTFEELDGIHLINTPSIGMNNGNGLSNPGSGFMIEVYENEVLFRARDFAQGKYLPDYDATYTIE